MFIFIAYCRQEDHIENCDSQKEIQSFWLRMSFQVVKENVSVQNKYKDEH